MDNGPAILCYNLLYSGITCLTSGEDDADGKTGGRIKDHKQESKTDAKSTI